jgi:hypothetical protein
MLNFFVFSEFEFLNFFVFLISLLCSDYCSVYFYKSTSLYFTFRNVVTGNKFGSKTGVLKLCVNFAAQCSKKSTENPRIKLRKTYQ